MTTRFYYEDGQGRMVDKQGNNAMDWVEEATPFHLKTLTRIREYCEKQEDEQLLSQEDLKNLDSDMEDLLFVYYNRIKLLNAAKSGRLTGGISERTAQKWAKKLKEDKDWNIFEKQTNLVNRAKPQLDDNHKLHLLSFNDNYTQARVVDAMDSLTQKFSDLSSGFNINMRPPSGWSLKGKPDVTVTPTGRAVSHTVLGAISAKFVVSMELQKHQVKPRSQLQKGTITSHYMKFLEKILDEMGFFPELKDIIMDNAPIHTADQIDEMIVARWYKSIYLPPYSPELNPIEQFWAIVKNKVKRCSFEPTEDLPI
ncbi:hypothetical protein G6F37_002270 [Rhizopus arrhizus]|nr:hypothetical protein G6F38_003821 [Rhizopus arrhizus]KAG1162323.1 hypothetical protein G6F37_002270 [Rhizopus arrhizus]